MKNLTKQPRTAFYQKSNVFSLLIKRFNAAQASLNSLKASVKRHLNAFKRYRLKPRKNTQKPEFAATGAK